jgi:hypothetical protein
VTVVLDLTAPGGVSLGGIPSDPTALAVLEKLGTGVLDAGVADGLLFVHGTAAPGTAGGPLALEDIPFPVLAAAADPAAGSVAPSAAPFTLVVLFEAGVLPARPADPTGTAAGPVLGPDSGEPAFAAPRTAVHPAPGLKGLALPLTTDDPRDAAIQPEIQDRLRRLDLYQPTDEQLPADPPVPRPAPDAATTADAVAGDGARPGVEHPAEEGATLQGGPTREVGRVGEDGLSGREVAVSRPSDAAAAGLLLPREGWEWQPALVAVLVARGFLAGPEGRPAPDESGEEPRRRYTGGR